MPNLIKLRNAVDAMVRVLVVDSDAVVVELEREDNRAVLHVVTSTRDLGHIIGKQGRTVRALRTLVFAASQKIDKTVLVDISSASTEPTVLFAQN